MEIEGIPPATEMKETVEGLISSHRVTQPAVAYILAIVVSLIVCIAAMIVMLRRNGHWNAASTTRSTTTSRSSSR